MLFRSEFILLGRCGNYAYRGYPEMVSVFLAGDKNLRIDRIMKTHNIGRREAENRQMSLSMLMNHRSQMLQKVLTLLMEVLELSL